MPGHDSDGTQKLKTGQVLTLTWEYNFAMGISSNRKYCEGQYADADYSKREMHNTGENYNLPDPFKFDGHRISPDHFTRGKNSETVACGIQISRWKWSPREIEFVMYNPSAKSGPYRRLLFTGYFSEEDAKASRLEVFFLIDRYEGSTAAISKAKTIIGQTEAYKIADHFKISHSVYRVKEPVKRITGKHAKYIFEN